MIATALHLAFLLVSAPIIGATLLLAIATLTGARWTSLAPFAWPLPWLVPVAALVMLTGSITPLPPHLATWQHPIFVSARALLTMAALAFAATRLTRGASATFAAITLALYAALITPIATDWMLADVPGHSVSAIGMILFVQQIAAACALVLITDAGNPPTRRDLAKLLVAAVLGLCYLAFMDYLIIWFGNLPDRVPFYLVRSTPGMAALAIAAILCGLAIPIAALGLGQPKVAGASALAGVALFDLWWLGGGILPTLAALLFFGITAIIAGRRAHG